MAAVFRLCGPCVHNSQWHYILAAATACLCYSQLLSVVPSIRLPMTSTVNITVEQYQFYN